MQNGADQGKSSAMLLNVTAHTQLSDNRAALVMLGSFEMGTNYFSFHLSFHLALAGTHHPLAYSFKCQF